MRRGSICWVNLEPSSPPEFGKVRPGLILSNSEQNTLLATVVVIPISTRPPEIWPFRLGFKMPAGRRAFAVIPGIRQVNKARLGNTLGLCPPGFLDGVLEALQVYLSE